MPTPFKSFADLCDSLQSTTKRLKKRHTIAIFLKSLSPEEVQIAVSFLLGRAFPEPDARVLDLGGATIWRLHPSRQTALVGEPLTIGEVAQVFDKIAGASGTGSRGRKEALIEGLLGRAAGREAEYLYRILGGEMHIGVVEGIIMEAISEAAGLDLAIVQRANMLTGNLGEVARLALSGGGEGLKNAGIRLFTPIKPMLAEMSYDIGQVLREHGGTTAFEWKFDGARVQIHKKGATAKIYSRSLSDITASLPELVALAQGSIGAGDALVEGEAVALGEGNRPLPFQDLMRRFRRTRDVENIEKRIPIRLYLFDILYKDGRQLIDLPYAERWRTLEEVVQPSLLAPRIVTGSEQEARAFLESALAGGHEGLMVKTLAGRYSPGARGKLWFKIKPFETLDLAIIGAEWGYGRREGWLSNYHLAALDDQTGNLIMLGKTFKGLTDDEFRSLTRRLLETKVRAEGNAVFVRPSIVVEVAYNEIQKSRQYKAGYTLRFARITRIREDRALSEIDTIQRVEKLYRAQFLKKAMPGGDQK